ncbi:hypothetical protein TNCT_609871 [Trichonephila clavata]|uniref:Uncharacterized protein n=1 Tax=Trichonephila clavata TaxID=2740835 RepID=A0A8X6KVQ1_TRICU|nr:hypothetical protein TNCT_609871 [Trichonephila clavata]
MLVFCKLHLRVEVFYHKRKLKDSYFKKNIGHSLQATGTKSGNAAEGLQSPLKLLSSFYRSQGTFYSDDEDEKLCAMQWTHL